MHSFFHRFARQAAEVLGNSWAFVGAAMVIIVWALTGPIFHFSDTWQLVINTGTSVTTFLMVFLIQNTQNREAKATQLKLDELIRSIKTARNAMVDIEDDTDEELKELKDQFEKLHQRYLEKKKR